MTTLSLSSSPNTLFDRFAKLNWGIITILCALAFVGVLMHFSVSSGAWTDMPLTHGLRFAVIMVVVIVAALVAAQAEYRIARAEHLSRLRSAGRGLRVAFGFAFHLLP